MRATIVVHLQGGPEQALRCFESLALLPPEPEHEVIVVDDASVGLEELLARLEGDVNVISLEHRTGFAGSIERAAREAGGDVLVMLRGAPEVSHGWLAPLVNAVTRDGFAAAASVAAGDPRAHLVSSYALAVPCESARSIPAVADEQVFAALCLALGGRAEQVPASTLVAPGTRMGAARRVPGEEPELTVVIPTLDAAGERVRACVSAVQARTEGPYDIVLIDNGAPPQGFTAPVNAGLRAARGRYAVVMNDDVEVLPGWWPPLRDALDAGASVTFPVTIDGAMRTDFAAWCFAVSRDSLERFAVEPGEFFDPRFRIWYQDTDLLARLREAGTPPVCVDGSQIRHGLSETVASDDPELRAWIEREIASDREAFVAKHPDAQLSRVAIG
ncbi:MAG TPA: glycosyltransferase, partial [Thermoleophilaceae bacterium]|nr:glycosyltransferase [Thermoleophilaceae bacterium]